MTIANTCLDHMPSRSIAILSRRSGVNVQTIRHMATRGKIVNLATIVALAAAINATVHVSIATQEAPVAKA
jgi:DNA-directed RNA polymerase beta' subunit